MPLAVEYFVFAALFNLIIFLAYGVKGIKDFSISAFFLVAVGVLYVIDDVYPYGRFTPFQILTTTTAGLAATVLNLLGYPTSISFMRDSYYGYMPSLKVLDPINQSLTKAKFEIAWPCAGVEGLIIYTITILLFLKKTPLSWRERIIYFVIGAQITYFINALRIASIFVIAINSGWRPNYMPPEVMRFHNIYGPLFSISWIIAYPLIILVSRALWEKIRNCKTSKGMT
jgi:exosortase/archaeosortase family protein